MPVTGDGAAAVPVDGERLLALALSRPADAVAEADRLLAGRPDPYVASIARQARAIVWRDAGRSADAVVELRRAFRLATRSADPRRVADVEATLGLTLGFAGRVAAGLVVLDRAVAATTGVDQARIRLRRAYLMRIAGRPDAALTDLRWAIRMLRRAGDLVWEARSLSHRFLVYAALGQGRRADRDLVRAGHLFAVAGQELEAAMTVHNRADLAFQAGDLPAALGFLDEADERYTALHTIRPTIAIDRCAVLLAAGLAAEAVRTTEAALRRFQVSGGNPVTTAELTFAVAQAAQAASQPALAAKRAGAAQELFRQQGRRTWQARASFVVLQARYAAGEDARTLRRPAGRLAQRLDEANAPESPAAHLLAGRVAAAAGHPAAADRHLALAARSRNRGPTFGRAAGWLAHALRAEARGATAATLVACRRGLAAAGEHLTALAAPELRAHAAAYGVDLALLAQRHAVQRADARMLLCWSERWRASALSAAPVRAGDDRELAADLGALRGVVRKLDQGPAAGADAERLHGERRRLEAAIRARTRRATGSRPLLQGTVEPGDVVRLLDDLGGHRLVEITSVDDVLYAVTVVNRRVRLHRVGPLHDAVREVELARFMLRRLAHGRAPEASLSALEAAGRRLQQALLGSAAAVLGIADLAGTIVVVPPARLHAVPWGMVPILRAAPFAVAPSAATWQRAGRLRPPRHRRVSLIIGPGLAGGAAEVHRIAAGYPEPLVLANGAATAEAALAALDDAWTAHVCAHGSFRGENPLFSALRLADGPLTVYDLGRLRRGPYRLVLSSCESGMAAHVGADELLGMLTALVPLGTASLLGSIVPVNDTTATTLMVDFHDALRAGASFPAALCAVRAGADRARKPVTVATALSLVALGR